MIKKNLSQMMIIMRAPSGSGKSTMAHLIQRADPDRIKICSTDDFWHEVNPGTGELKLSASGRPIYNFDPTRIGEAHAWNQTVAEHALASGHSVIIDNTNMTRWEMEPYIQIARRFKVRLWVLEAALDQIYRFDSFTLGIFCTKPGIDHKMIERQQDTFEPHWREGDPRPPWQRK